jgi:hypothetical protein
MVDGLQIHIRNRRVKPLAIAVSEGAGVGRWWGLSNQCTM